MTTEKNSFGYTDFCHQSDVFAFLTHCLDLLWLSFQVFFFFFFFCHRCLIDMCHHLFYKLNYGFKWNAQDNIYKHQGELSIASLFHLEKRRFPDQAGFDL